MCWCPSTVKAGRFSSWTRLRARRHLAAMAPEPRIRTTIGRESRDSHKVTADAEIEERPGVVGTETREREAHLGTGPAVATNVKRRNSTAAKYSNSAAAQRHSARLLHAQRASPTSPSNRRRWRTGPAGPGSPSCPPAGSASQPLAHAQPTAYGSELERKAAEVRERFSREDSKVKRFTQQKAEAATFAPSP